MVMVNGLTPPLLNNNLNFLNGGANPFRLDRSQAATCDNDNHYTDEQEAFDGGLMDKFSTCIGPSPRANPFACRGIEKELAIFMSARDEIKQQVTQLIVEIGRFRRWRFRASELDLWMRSPVNSVRHPCRLNQEKSDGT
jgi:hypothetical protein